MKCKYHAWIKVQKERELKVQCHQVIPGLTIRLYSNFGDLNAYKLGQLLYFS